MTQNSQSRGIVIPRQDRLTEFQFNEPISTPIADAIPWQIPRWLKLLLI